MNYEAGQSFRIFDHSFCNDSMKIHIMYVLDGIYKDQKLIVYRYFGKHKRWWHQFICTDEEMNFKVELYNRSLKK